MYSIRAQQQLASLAALQQQQWLSRMMNPYPSVARPGMYNDPRWSMYSSPPPPPPPPGPPPQQQQLQQQQQTAMATAPVMATAPMMSYQDQQQYYQYQQQYDYSAAMQQAGQYGAASVGMGASGATNTTAATSAGYPSYWAGPTTATAKRPRYDDAV
eukprot:Filipodium_phascolosomae@DN2486_c0_g1_i1.p1